MTNRIADLLVVASSPDWAECHRLMRDAVKHKSDEEFLALLQPEVDILRKMHARFPEHTKNEIALMRFQAWKVKAKDEIVLGFICAACHVFLTTADSV